MSQEYVETKKTKKKGKKKGFKQRLKDTFFTLFHILAHIFIGFGAKSLGAKVLRGLIAMGDSRAMFKLGEMYWWGYKFARDPVKAIELIEYAAIRGHPDAIHFKAEMTEDGLWRQGKNRDEFMEMFDEHITKESNQRRSMNLWWPVLYTGILVGSIWLVAWMRGLL
ncbi:hypothetical protein MNBD_GAMMA12-322 [hydrothermal vent metagenome]|uniref:Uncharacterized protein n=1 Tax=hydrothermal vent metagenome TaxID=652676 RepID=A0A3B0YPR5_9ZZZZ